jgi:hypothetical protein
MSELTEADRKAIEEYLYKIDIDDFDTVYCKMAAEWGILHARAEAEKNRQLDERIYNDAAKSYMVEIEEKDTRIKELEALIKHNAEGWLNAVAEKDKYKDRVKELEAEGRDAFATTLTQEARIMELEAEVARLKIEKDAVGRGMQQYIDYYKAELAALQSPSSANESTGTMDDKILKQQSKMIEGLNAGWNPSSAKDIPEELKPEKSPDYITNNYVSAKDTPDKRNRYEVLGDIDKDGKYFWIADTAAGYRIYRSDEAFTCNEAIEVANALNGQSSPVSVDINRELVEALKDTMYMLKTTADTLPDRFPGAKRYADKQIEKAMAALSKASPPKPTGKEI